MIKIRKLKYKDIPFMLEWMHDSETKSIFQHKLFLLLMNEKQLNLLITHILWKICILQLLMIRMTNI